ncbi:biotin--[acetyl-CoA-carboxylase] ligase [Algicella marina]|uniref:biotin--[biotin carboxyl-carrier protein] ligase n=1 Tax=Algicella marina TaxID=2683284 RepID=A0A6P1T725_9RHOB|nr:biotin--[acetyl-CoA-carboxylase] ligase [Algicella marina]
MLEQVDSTNAEAVRALTLGTRAPFWLMAHHQTAGRGRGGRPWSARAGNFFGTLMMEVPQGPQAAGQRSFVAALALRDVVAGLVPDTMALSLKWPNDVLLMNRKLAGILLESETVKGRLMLRVGIGVNLAAVPEQAELESGALTPVHLGGVIGPEAFLDLLAAAFAKWDDTLLREGFAPIRAAWLNHAARLGEPIRARLPGQELHGTFETVDEGGALVLNTAKGRMSLPAADVFF